MKKSLIILMMCVSTCLISSCGNKNVEDSSSVSQISESSVSDVSETEDYSQIDITCIPSTPDEYKSKNVVETYSDLSYNISMDLDDIAQASDSLVMAKVNSYSYTALGNSENGKNAWTVINATVSEDTGNFEAGTEIEIYTFGGFISMRDSLGDVLYSTGGKYGDETNTPSEEEIDNTVYYEMTDSSELPIINQEYAFYITERNDGICELTCGQYGVLLKCEDTFIRKSADEIETYSIDELKNLLA